MCEKGTFKQRLKHLSGGTAIGSDIGSDISTSNKTKTHIAPRWLTSLTLLASLASPLIVAGCSFAPVYHPPAVAVPSTYKETGKWQSAHPADRALSQAWWKVFRDRQLDALEPRVNAANPTVAAALAAHDASAALLQQARAGLLPTLSLDIDPSRQRQSAMRPLRGSGQPDAYGDETLGVGAGYDLDIWGKVRNQIAAGRADEQASEDDAAAITLSLQTSLADAYFTLIGLDRQAAILQQTQRTYAKALQLTMSRHQGGIASDLDVSRAQTQWDAAQAQASDIAGRRALCEHAIATLVGAPASAFTLAPTRDALATSTFLPNVPVGIPATLLQRRPDIAAAERRIAAANASIGVAKAAFYPDLTLGLEGGFQSTTFSPWISAPNEIWSVGPQLMMSLFDGGRRSAVLRQTRAKLAQNGAQYRAVVLDAFQQVEDQLATLHHVGDEAKHENDELNAAKQTLTLSMSRYKDGAVDYLDVVTAQTTVLQAETRAATLRTRRLQADVNLIGAIGGGWK